MTLLYLEGELVHDLNVTCVTAAVTISKLRVACIICQTPENDCYGFNLPVYELFCS